MLSYVRDIDTPIVKFSDKKWVCAEGIEQKSLKVPCDPGLPLWGSKRVADNPLLSLPALPDGPTRIRILLLTGDI